jgi:hypothetical protein
VIVPLFTVKLAAVADAATETDAGTVKSVVLSDRATETPVAGAALLSVTVHVPVALEASV